MAFEKITSEDTAGKGNVGLPDTPALTTTEMQEQMDSLPNLIIDKFNALIDALGDETGATYLGATVPAGITALGNVQSVLNAMVTDLALCVSAKHTHSNLITLEEITSQNLTDYNALVAMLAGIVAIEQILTNDSTKIPSSSAVKAFVDNYDFRTKILNTAYPVDTVYSTKGTAPTTLFGGTWNLLDTDASGVKRYQRVS